MKTISMTREQLYERVWATPVDALSKEFGISNVGLGKLCRRYAIPVPPRGHWAKKAAGHRTRTADLPVAKESWQNRITIHGSPRRESGDPEAPEIHPQIAFEQDPAHQIVVDSDVAVTHATVLKTARLLRRAKRETDGMVSPPPGALPIRTARARHERAFRLWQVLLTALEERNYTISIDEKGTSVTVLDEP